MANDWFDFKEFRIEQKGASFKVGTDGCLLGAWVNPNGAKTILDIGTGTGLIALMLAQRTNATIQTIDIEAEHVEVAKRNASLSKWNKQITVVHDSLQGFAKHAQPFELIVCNPPFFENSTKNPSLSKTVARHTVALTLAELFGASSMLSLPSTQLAVVLPFDRLDAALVASSSHGWWPSRCCSVRAFEHKAPNRVLLQFARQPTEIQENILTLYAVPSQYSPEAIALLKPFYLHL